MSKEILSCKNCFHSREGEIEQDLNRVIKCVRFPPVAQAMPTNAGIANITSWPVVKAGDYCGEFKPCETGLIN